MTIAESIREVLRKARRPMSSLDIFEQLKDEVERPAVSIALNGLLKAGHVRRKQGDERSSNGRTLYLYTIASSAPASAEASGTDLDGPGPAREEATPSATPARAPTPSKSASSPPPAKKGRGRRTIDNHREAAEIAIETGFAKAVARNAVDELLRDAGIHTAPPASTLEIAIWSSGAVDLVRGNESLRLERDDVDQLKALLDRVYAAVKAVPA